MSSGIKTTDTNVDRFAKILPADVTAAFLSIRTGIAAIGQGEAYTNGIIYSFVAILLLCPFYFRLLMDVKNWWQNGFLCLSFMVFGLSIASDNFIAYFGARHELMIKIIATVAPILWAFMITPMFLKVAGDKLVIEASADEKPAQPSPVQP